MFLLSPVGVPIWVRTTGFLSKSVSKFARTGTRKIKPLAEKRASVDKK
jgi:hypothetical protein